MNRDLTLPKTSGPRLIHERGYCFKRFPAITTKQAADVKLYVSTKQKKYVENN